MTARRFLPLAPALLVVCLAASAFEARATDLRVDSAVTQTNNGVILDGDGKIEITSKGSITVNADSPALPAPLNFEPNTGILLRGAESDFGSPSSNNTITNNGEIIVSGDNSEGVHVVDSLQGTNNTLTNHGLIRASGSGAIGVLFSPNSMITNNYKGIIETLGDNAGQAIITGPNPTIINNGLIRTNTKRGPATILIRPGTGEISTGGKIINNARGRILHEGELGPVISIQNRITGFTIDNAGEITASGADSRSKGVDFGDNSANSNNTLNNSGTITTNGDGAQAVLFGDEEGLDNNSTGNKLNNTGTIDTKGDNASAVQGGSGNTITNGKGGVIKTAGEYSYGIELKDNNTLTLNGGIMTKGRGAHGLLTGTGTTLNPIGPNSRIQTMAADADGLRIGGLAAGQTTLTHRGHIEAGGTGIRLPYVQMFDNSGHILGMNGAGLHFTGVTGPLSLTNTGMIAGRTGIQIDRMGMGANVTIDNAGALRSRQGAAGTALDLRGQGQDTLHLRAGSILEGQIRWDGEGDLLRLEALGPTRLTFIDNDAPANEAPTAFTVNKPQGLLEFRSTMTSNTRGQAQTTLTLLNPARTDPRTEATQSLWTSAIFQSLAQQQIAQRLLHSPANRRSGHTALHSALWVRPFGGLQNYKRAGQTPAARYRYGGALAGYGMATAEWQAGAFVGAARSELMSRGQEGIEVEGREVFLGAYGQTRWQALQMSVAVLFGKSRHDTAWLWRDNRVSGGLVRRRYEGKHDFISPELGLSTHINIQGMTLIPELTLRYLGLFNAEARARQADGLRFKPEDRHIGLIRASLGFPLSFPENQYGGRLSGQLRVGAEGRKRLGGDRIEIRSGNNTARYRAGSDNAIMGFVGAGFEYGVSAMNLSFSAEVEAGYDSEAALGVRGQFGFVWGF